jgi:predicted MFS family arabinose efflux permease
MWSTNLIVLSLSVFFINFGNGLFRGAATNFYVDTLGLNGTQVLWLAGLREIPGLALIVIAATIMHLSLPRRAAVAVLLMGAGYALYATVQSYAGLIAVAIAASLGFHTWMPLQNSLAMSLVERSHSGKVMGTISSVRALASIVGMGAIALLTRFVAGVSLRAYFVAGGVLIVIAGLFLFRIPRHVGAAQKTQRRMLLKKRYWLYYVLIFFEGSRVQVFGTFGTLILVENYGLEVWQISLLLLGSGLVNFLLAPRLGTLLDILGEYRVLPVSYLLLSACFVGYATFHSPWVLGAILILINLLVTLAIGLSTYVRRFAPEEELVPTLSAGVSINHITSVSMSILAGTLLATVGYEKLCWGAAIIILASVPFAAAMRVKQSPVEEMAGSPAK